MGCAEQQATPAASAGEAIDSLPGLPTAPKGTWDGRWEEQSRWPDGVVESYAGLAEAFLAEDFPLSQSRAYALLSEHAELPPAMHILGLSLFRLRRYTAAASVFERFLLHAPDHVSMTRALGHCYYSVGLYEEARAHYQRILEGTPESLESVFGLALTEMRLGGITAARDRFESVLQGQPKHADAAYWLARLCFDEELGEWEAVQAACQKAIELDPTDPRVWFLSAEIAHEQGDAQVAALARARFEWLESKQGQIRSLQQRLLFEPHLESATRSLTQLKREVEERVESF